ncbi:MAG: ABC transporter permease subunit [Oscillospiraceae bacterium]
MKKIKNTSTGFDDSYSTRFAKDWHKNWKLYAIFLPILVYYIVFCYIPMYGIIIAFKDFTPINGIFGSKWVGFKHFIDFFQSADFGRILFNTLNISLNSLLWSFPAPIILALMINEVKSTKFKKTIQTITYMPHFVSLVVACGIITSFMSDSGLITNMLYSMGFLDEKVNMLGQKEVFVPTYILSSIWQEVGWGSIIYLAALSGINMDLYEAASIDGAGRWRQLFSITIPSIMPTIIIMLILRIGSIMSVGFEKIILLYNPLTYETADVISTYVYRRGLMEFNFSYSSIW